MLLEQLDIHINQINLYTYLRHLKKLIQNGSNLNVKYKTIKLLEGNIRENLHDRVFGKIDKLKTFVLQNVLLKEYEK